MTTNLDAEYLDWISQLPDQKRRQAIDLVIDAAVSEVRNNRVDIKQALVNARASVYTKCSSDSSLILSN